MGVTDCVWACVCVWVRERLLRKSAPVKAFSRFFVTGEPEAAGRGGLRFPLFVSELIKPLFSLLFLRFCNFGIRKTFIFLAFFDIFAFQDSENLYFPHLF